MRFSEKSEHSHQIKNQLFGVDFHDFIQKEPDSTFIELASEFGISVRDVKTLKKQINRS
jgi:hypothetical protein